MKIQWTQFAETKLQEIFDYYKRVASIQIAHKIKTKIFKRTRILKNHPRAGPVEELLLNEEEEYRYLVEGNYKIIYWIDEDIVKIATVFNCRQNPKKLIVDTIITL